MTLPQGPYIIFLLLALHLSWARASQNFTAAIFTTACVTRPPAPSVLVTNFRRPRIRAIESLSINPCASSCFNSAVTKSTTCDLGDWECGCEPTNENIIVDAAQGCVNDACGAGVGDGAWSEVADFCSSLNTGAFGFSSKSSLGSLNTGLAGTQTTGTGAPSTSASSAFPTSQTTTAVQTPSTTGPGSSRSSNLNGGEIAGIVAGIVGAIAGVFSAYYGWKTYRNRQRGRP